jgi:exopolysaccharide production protein ExoZ
MNKISQWLEERFELSRGGSGHNLRVMEGMRGFAVFLVFLVHYAFLVNPWVAQPSTLHQFSDTLYKIGNAGVDLFFVLSGYLIYGSLIARPQKFTRYMRRRIKRIYPAFLVVFAVYVLLSFLFPSESKIPHDLAGGTAYLIANLLLLPGIFPIEPIITVAWSLSYEILYYLLVPLVIIIAGLRLRSSLWRIIFFFAVAMAFLALCTVYGGPVRLVTFVAGILLYEVLNQQHIRAPGSGIGLLALVVALLMPLSAGIISDALKAVIISTAFFIFCFSCFSSERKWLAQGFCFTPLRWLGNMSYSYYLIHGLALKFFFLVLAKALHVSAHGTLFFFALLAVSFTLSLIPAIILFLTVERPLSLATKHLAEPSTPVEENPLYTQYQA